jgi:hypothetical protein
MTGSNAQGMTGSNAQGMTGSNAQGMTGSNARGMTGSNAQGMTGSNAQGMTGSNAQGMTGSNAQGMTGSNARGMTGSNAQGMTGSNARGMTGSNAQGMTGSNAQGITGSNARGMTGRYGRVLAAQSTSRFGSGFSVAAMGVLEAISIQKGMARLIVAGQAFGVPSTEASVLSVGDYVVAGAAEGAMAVVYHAGVPYIAGLSTVRVKATVNAADPTTGTLSVGGLTVDYTSQLSLDPALAPLAGDVIEVVGLQAITGGTLTVGSSSGGLTVASPGRQ